MINVLVVDDSAFMRKMLADMLESHEQIHVAGKARNGREALAKIAAVKPDIVTMDVEMPIMSGIDALKKIMAEHPLPVIMVSSMTKTGAEITMEAMSHGAVDFIAKPSNSISLDIQTVKTDLLTKVLAASAVELPKLSAAEKFSHANPPLSDKRISLKADTDVNEMMTTVVAVGASTGGPKALDHMLTALPVNFPYPILIVQHMPKGFTKSLAERLDSRASITVKEAENGETVKKGVAYLCPGGYHLKVKTIRTSVGIRLDQSPLVNGHRPSVDALFSSLAASSVPRVIAVIMTGMGSDGAKGLSELKQLKSTKAIGESEKTAVVYGMPRAAKETGYLDAVADLDDIAEVLLNYR